MITEARILMSYLSFGLMTLAVTLLLNCGKDKNDNPPPPAPPATVYSNATLTGTWMINVTFGPADTASVGYKFDGNGNMVENYDLNPGALPSPYIVQADGSFTIIATFSNGPSVTATGALTSTTTGAITAVDGSPVTGTLRKVMDLGACQGTWAGTQAGAFANSFTITVDNTGTIISGDGFTPTSGKLFCESGDVTGYLATTEVGNLSRIHFYTGTVVTGATVTINGNYQTNGGRGTYALVSPPPATVYSNATLTGTWMMKLNTGVDIVTSGLKFDGNGNIVETEVADNPLSPSIFPSPYAVQSNGSFTLTWTFSSAPTMTFTGTLTSSTTGSVTAVDGSPVTGYVRKVMDLGACQGTWAGTLAEPFNDSFTIDVDNTGTITGGTGFTAPYTGKLFCESGDATGSLGTGANFPLNWIKFQTGTVVTGATVTISGNYETNNGNGTYTLIAPPPASLPMKGTSGNAVNMNGTWKQCKYLATSQPVPKDELDKVTFSGGSATATLSIWDASTTANCQQTTTPDALYKITVTATLGAEATATWTDGAGSTSPPPGVPVDAKATMANVTLNSATLTMTNPAYVNDFNNNARCGKTDWAVNVAIDVSNCPDVFAIPSTDYWVVDDSAAVLKWYSQGEFASAAYQVDSINPHLK